MPGGRSGPRSVKVGGREIGPGHPCFIVAEAGVNHNGDPELARRLVDVAAEARADAVKFQTFRADRLATPEAPKAGYQQLTTRPGESQLEMLRKLELSPDTFRDLWARCAQRGLLFMSTPFDEESVEFLDALGVPVFKVASGEVTNLPFLDLIARKGKPVILSTGMAYLSEVDEAVRTIRQAGNEQLVLLHCVSNYPAHPADINLRAMRTMETAFGVPVGFSDHTLGIEVALAAVALGAAVVEKHFTLDRGFPGPDHLASLEPAELRALIASTRKIEQALGAGVKVPVPAETEHRAIVCRSLAMFRNVQAGVRLEASMLCTLRPGTGIPPAFQSMVVGRKTRRELAKGELLAWEDLE